MLVRASVDLHQRGAPDLTDVVDLVVSARPKGAETVRKVRVVGELPNAGGVVLDPVTNDDHVVDGAGHVVAPPLAHATALDRVQRVLVRAASHQAAGDPVGEL